MIFSYDNVLCRFVSMSRLIGYHSSRLTQYSNLMLGGVPVVIGDPL
jgi:hypothetical protein